MEAEEPQKEIDDDIAQCLAENHTQFLRRELVEALHRVRDQNKIVIRTTRKRAKGADGENFRGSKFRGVSKNGSQWQVLIMVNKKKRYIGTISTEIEAARLYDKVAIQNHGVKARTNYDYTKEEILNVLNEPTILRL